MPPLSILYQDDNLVAIHKPSGLLVHRSPIDKHETRFALQMVRDQIGQRVYPLHRLDKPTSGVLLFALSSDIARHMGNHFAQHNIEKRYLAVVRGHAPDAGFIDHALKEEWDKMADGKLQTDKPSQLAQTHYRRLATAELPVMIETYPQSRYSLVECKPLTGRKHQIRRHLKHINHPIIGDAKHGRGRHNRFFRDQLNVDRLLLHAASLSFPHPETGHTTHVHAPLQGSMFQLLDRFGWLPQLQPEWVPTITEEFLL